MNPHASQSHLSSSRAMNHLELDLLLTLMQIVCLCLLKKKTNKCVLDVL